MSFPKFDNDFDKQFDQVSKAQTKMVKKMLPWFILGWFFSLSALCGFVYFVIWAIKNV